MSNLPSIPFDVRALAEEGRAALLPVRSRQQYERAFKQFIKWCRAKEIDHGQFLEEIVLAYMVELSLRYAASSLWSHFSMLRKSLLSREGFDLGESPQVVAFLKRKNDNHTVKKSAIFARAQIEEILDNVPNSDYFTSKLRLSLLYWVHVEKVS